MLGASAPVSIPVTVIDREASANLAKITGHVERLDNVFGKLSGRIKAGLQWHLVYNGIRLIENAISGVLHAIPDLISRGQQWTAVVDDISDATGMTARQSSELAAVQLMLGGSTESLSKALVQLSKNARMHEDILAEMGVATRDQHGNFLGIYQILQNLRNAYASTGDRATAFGRAYQQLGRGTREVTDLLALNAGQYATLAAQAQRAGLIVDATMARNAETLKRTQSILDATITGLGNQILGRVSPVLTALVNGISKAIQDNMGAILRFVVTVVNAIAGFLSGLFGLDLNLVNIAGQLDRIGSGGERAGQGLKRFGQDADTAGAASERASRAIQRQIDAIDRQIKALDRRQDREDARREQQRLLQDIAEAKRELEEIRSTSIFAAGMSDAEAELARQARAANIIDAEKRIQDAKRAMRDFEREQERKHQREMLEAQRDALQKQLSAQRAASAEMVRAAGITGIRMGRGLSKGFEPLSDAMKRERKSLMELGRDALETGKNFAAGFKDLLFGPESTHTLPGPGGVSYKSRDGGLVGGLKAMADGAISLGKFLGEHSKSIGEWFPKLITALAAAVLAWKLGGLGGLLPQGPLPGPQGGKSGPSGIRGVPLGVWGLMAWALASDTPAGLQRQFTDPTTRDDKGRINTTWMDQLANAIYDAFNQPPRSGGKQSLLQSMAWLLPQNRYMGPWLPWFGNPGGASNVNQAPNTGSGGSGISNWFWSLTTGNGLPSASVDARRWFDYGSPLLASVAGLQSSTQAIADAIEGGGTGGGDGGTTLTSRVTALEAQMAGDEPSWLRGAIAEHADSIRERARIDYVDAGFGTPNSAPTRNSWLRSAIGEHADSIRERARIDYVDAGFGTPNSAPTRNSWLRSAISSHADSIRNVNDRVDTVRRINKQQWAAIGDLKERVSALEGHPPPNNARAQSVTIQLDRGATKAFLGGRAVNTSLRPVPGV